MRTVEEYEVGQIERFGHYAITREEVLEFAGRFDPQPFHLDDDAAAANPIFGKLAASGWHTASATMRMIVDHGRSYGGYSIGGAGLDELRWTRPVYPGDTLSAQNEVLEIRRPKSRPDIAFIKLQTTTFNQDGETVMIMTANIMVPTKASD
jgi:acyl dehydratase